MFHVKGRLGGAKGCKMYSRKVKIKLCFLRPPLPDITRIQNPGDIGLKDYVQSIAEDNTESMCILAPECGRE